MFSSLELNHACDETDIMVSLCKLKQHLTTGVTLPMNRSVLPASRPMPLDFLSH
jgi:uncharacterized protein (DUF362 family)